LQLLIYSNLQRRALLQDRLEAQPVRFMEAEVMAGLRRAQLSLARVGMRGSMPCLLCLPSGKSLCWGFCRKRQR
jgi:hypothetical protein